MKKVTWCVEYQGFLQRTVHREFPTEARAKQWVNQCGKAREARIFAKFPSDPSDPDSYYGLEGSCVGCRRVTWLCRRDRRCSKYAATPRRGYVASRTGYVAAK